MRKACIIVAVLLATAGYGWADVDFAQPNLDLGSVRTGQVLEQTLTLTNRGAAAVQLTEVKGSCGCLQPEFTPQALPPGKSVALKLRINTLSASPGQQVWRLTLRYQDNGERKDALLTIRAFVIQEIIVQPPALIVYADMPTQHDITVTDLRPEPLKVMKAEASKPFLQVTRLPDQRNAADQLVQRLHLILGADVPVGRHDETLFIFTGDPTYRILKVAVTVIRRGRQRYTALPSTAALIATPGQATTNRMVTIRDSQGQPITIDRVTADDPAISCTWVKGPNTVGTVKITVDCNKVTTERLESHIHVFIQGAGSEGLTIPVTCEGR